jgi:hypothetical protein
MAYKIFTREILGPAVNIVPELDVYSVMDKSHTEYQSFQHQVVTLKPRNCISSTHMRNLDG